MSSLKKNGTPSASIIDALADVGIVATAVESCKNGVVCQGYQLETGKPVKPVVYFSAEDTVESFVAKVIHVMEQPGPEIDIENLINKDRLLKDTILCIQKRSSEAIVKRDFLNVEVYVRLFVPIGSEENTGSIKVTDQILQSVGISEEELFATAKTNSVKLGTVTSMAEALAAPPELFEDAPFFVGTYRRPNGSLVGHGAAVLVMPEILHKFARTNNYGKKRFWLIPSSTEEILILKTDKVGADDLCSMVNEVNITSVDPILQLDPVVYMFDDETQEITIASSYSEEV